MFSRILILVVVFLVALSSSPVAAPQFKVYRIKDGATNFNTWFSPLAFPRINNQYQIVLEAYQSAPRIGVWSNGVLTRPALPAPADTFKNWTDIIPFGINNHGHVVGQIFSYYHSHGFQWDSAVTELLPFDSAHWINPNNNTLWCERALSFDINDAGVASGHGAWARPDQQGFMQWYSRPVLWREGQIEAFGTLAGYPVDSVWYRDLPVRINNRDEICGTAQLRVSPNVGQYRAFFGSGGSVTEIPLWAGGYLSWAYDISDSGHVVGFEEFNEGSTHMKRAWRYLKGSKIDIHGTVFPNTAWSEAYGVNSQGQVVGAWVTGGSAPVTALYFDGDTTYNLNTLVTNFPGSTGGPTLNGNIVAAHGIADNGAIVATYKVGFFFYPCLLIPTMPGVVVNSEGDAPDLNSGDGKCWTGGYNSIEEEECTLRAALQHANQAANRDTITFRIPVPRIPSLHVQSELPDITEPIEVDATTQPNAGRVQLDGGGLAANALTITANGCAISGLTINNFDGYAISLLNSDSALITRNVLGPDTAGRAGAGNYGGLIIENSSHNRVGDPYPELANEIAYNQQEGLLVVSGSGNRVRRNIMYGNGGLGIDLWPVGVNPNDTLDPDTGPNGLANFPLLDSVVNVSGQTHFYGHMSAAPNTNYVIELFTSDSCDPSGYGEAQLSLWTTQVTTNADGVASFSSSISPVTLVGKYFTATATDWDDNTSEFSPCWPQKELLIIDAMDAPIANTWFRVSRVAHDRPSFTATLLDSAKTDNGGRLDLGTFLSSGGIALGDSIKIERQLAALPKVRNTLGAMANAITVYLDNASFDQNSYAMSYDELNSEPLQVVKLDHTTLAVNLIVGIEWEADQAYLDNLVAGLRSTSNYLYDVTDGQMRLDTVWIYNNSLLWRLADLRIYASNVLEPEAQADGLFSADPSARILFCRRWFGSADVSRDSTVIEWPMRPDGETNYRTIAHELGHYVLGLRDEYRVSSARCAPLGHYGFMDYQYAWFGPSTSEMSWSRQYENQACRNNEQWRENNGRSCWDHVEFVWQKEYGGIFAPIIKPDEQPGLNSRSFFFGPNDDMADLDYDVGQLVEFNIPSLPRVSHDTLITVRDPRSARTVSGAVVYHRKMPSGRMIAQGGTSSTGNIHVLGVQNGDSILASSALRIQIPGRQVSAGLAQPEWLSGSIEIGAPFGDSLVMDLLAVQGDLPLLVMVKPSGDSLDLRIDYLSPLPQEPTYEFVTDSGAIWSGTLIAGANHYVDGLPEDTAVSEGTVIVRASDLGNQPFFVPVSFRIERQLAGSGPRTLFSYDMATRLDLDTTTTDRTVVLTSCGYPPPSIGLLTGALQVSNIETVALSEGTVIGQPLGLAITYDPTGIDSAPAPLNEEERIRIFRWSEAGSWQLLSGWIDTSANVVYSSITQGGYYGAFTSDQLTAVGETPGGLLMPEGIGLAQNFPNPFNAGTVIEYTLPRAAHVRIEVLNLLGQTVRVLLDHAQLAGQHRLDWDGLNQAGDKVATGMYLYRLITGEYVETKKMLLLK